MGLHSASGVAWNIIASPMMANWPRVLLTTVTFDDLSGPNRGLNGQYAGIDWGSGSWYLSGPYGRFATNSVSYPNGAPV